jgi:hypothetical protein
VWSILVGCLGHDELCIQHAGLPGHKACWFKRDGLSAIRCVVEAWEWRGWGTTVTAHTTHMLPVVHQQCGSVDCNPALAACPAGEVRRVDLDCTAVVGTVSNHLQRMLNKGKAGTNRQMGRRPKVLCTSRGVSHSALLLT